MRHHYNIMHRVKKSLQMSELIYNICTELWMSELYIFFLSALIQQSSMFLGVALAPNSLLWQPRRYCLHYNYKMTVRTVLKFGFGNWVQYEHNEKLKPEKKFYVSCNYRLSLRCFPLKSLNDVKTETCLISNWNLWLFIVSWQIWAQFETLKSILKL